MFGRGAARRFCRGRIFGVESFIGVQVFDEIGPSIFPEKSDDFFITFQVRGGEFHDQLEGLKRSRSVTSQLTHFCRGGSQVFLLSPWKWFFGSRRNNPTERGSER